MRSVKHNLAGQSISKMQAGLGRPRCDIFQHPARNWAMRHWMVDTTALGKGISNGNIQPSFYSELIGTSGLGGLWGHWFFDFLFTVITGFCLSLVWELWLRLLCWDFSHFNISQSGRERGSNIMYCLAVCCNDGTLITGVPRKLPDSQCDEKSSIISILAL